VDHGGSGAEPDPGVAVSYGLLTGQSPVRSVASGVRGRDLGLPSAAGSRRQDPSGHPYEPEPSATVRPAVRPAVGGTCAFHHADPPVPQLAWSVRRGGVTRAGAVVDPPSVLKRDPQGSWLRLRRAKDLMWRPTRAASGNSQRYRTRDPRADADFRAPCGVISAPARWSAASGA
jgi:hypothetical protein